MKTISAIDKPRCKILFITCGTKIAPATRYRAYLYFPFLKDEGIEYKAYSIFSDTLTRKMINSSTFSRLQRIIYYIQFSIERIIRGLKAIKMAGKFDIVFLQRVTFPFGMEKLLKERNKNIIFDIDDAIYLPDSEENSLVELLKKYIKKKEVISILRVARCVIAENNYIKSFVEGYCKKVYLIIGPIDTAKNFPREYKLSPGIITIGWIGTPSTAVYLKMLDSVFKKLAERYKIKIRLISAGPYFISGVLVENISWDEKAEVSELHKFDIGVMPMPDNEWTRGKVGCKMLQYMANGIPSVVSYTPTTAEVIEDGINGFLADSEEEWVKKLSILIEDFQLRERIGLNGRKSAEENYSVNIGVRKFIGIIKNV